MRVTQNIIFILQNIKRHLTGREKIITSLALIITLIFGGVLSFDSAGAMTYQDEVKVKFKFEPSLSINLSSPTLRINNLVPGNYSNSNTITVDIDTNNVTGYTLTAKVGGVGQTAANSSLVNTMTNTTFTSLGDSDNIVLPNFADNKWGFSTAASITDATTFSGLLYNEDRVINLTTNNSGAAATGYTGTNSTKFTIGAKASADQAAGDYTNVITFTAVTNQAPITSIDDLVYMQEFATLESSEKTAVLDSMTLNQQYQLKDNRDEKSYYISKLADGNVWMTQNLDHDIVTTTDFYTYANTDIGHGATPNTSATWTAPSDVNSFSYSASKPKSNLLSDLCWDGTISPNENSNWNIYTETCGSDKHYHLGNNYNWTAAVAMSDSSSYTTDLTDVDQSICPAGWRLPTLSGDKSYSNLVTTLNLTSGASGNVQAAPTYFVYGYYNDGEQTHVGVMGTYLTSVVRNDWNAYGFHFHRDGSMDLQFPGSRVMGTSVRCVAR